MVRLSHRINSFAGGVVSPDFEGRVDTDKYSSSVRRLENFIVHPEGGAHKRPSTRHVSSASASATRLIPFISATERAYILEFGSSLFRVYADEVQLQVPERLTLVGEEASTTTNEFKLTDHSYLDGQGPYHITATAGMPAGLVADTDYYIKVAQSTNFTDSEVNTGTDIITLASAHGYSEEMGPFRFTTDGALPTGLSGNVDFYLLNVTTFGFQISITPGGSALDMTGLSGGNHAMTPNGDYQRDKFRLSATSGGAAINLTTAGTSPHTFTPNPIGSPSGITLEIPHGFGLASPKNIQYAQKADILFIDADQMHPRQIARLSDTQWSSDRQNLFDGPYLETNTDTTALITASATSGTNIDLTLSGTILVNEGDGWKSSDIGRFVRIKHSGTAWGFVEITGVVSSTVARATVRTLLGPSISTSEFRLGLWKKGNYPKSLSFSGQRLWHGGEPDSPQTVHGSQSGQFTSFAPTDIDALGTVLDSSATNFELSSNLSEPIKWLAVQNQLFAGTSSSITAVRASLDNEAVTPTNVTAPLLTAIGCSSLRPLAVGDELLYVTRNHQGLRAISADTKKDRNGPEDLTLLARHIFGYTETIVDSAYQLHRNQIAWFVLGDGSLSAITYIPSQQIFAWHTHTLGGNFNSGNPVVESIAVIPSLDGSHDRLWMIVKRTINGSTVRHVEFLEDEWLDGSETSQRFLDAASTAYSGVPISVVTTGLDHLEGETVSILTNGSPHPDRVVSGGSITLDNSYSDVLVGLPYTSELETLRLEVGDPEGSSTGKMARIDHIVMRLYNSHGGSIGSDVDHLDPLIFRDDSVGMDSPVPLFTGDKKIAFDGGFQREKRLVIRHSDPTAFNVLALNLIMSTGQR